MEHGLFGILWWKRTLRYNGHFVRLVKPQHLPLHYIDSVDLMAMNVIEPFQHLYYEGAQS